MDLTKLIELIKGGGTSPAAARQLARDAGIYTDVVEQALRTAHDEVMRGVCQHQSRMRRIIRD